MAGRWQRCIKRPLRFSGVGLHSGARLALQVLPAPKDSGIVFRAAGAAIPARIANVDARKSQLCTQLCSPEGPNISTIEHLMAALVASRISNAWVDIGVENSTTVDADGRATVELPVLDGSSREFMDSIAQAGVETQEGSQLSYLRIKRPVQVFKKDKAAWLLPMPEQLGIAPTLQMAVQVNFEHKRLGTHFCHFTLGGADPDVSCTAFQKDIASARTFTFEDEIAWMQTHGLARGGSLENAVVFASESKTAEAPVHAAGDGAAVLNKDGLRFSNEWVRHKMLDCIGDIGLAGLPLHGYFFASSPGHALTHELLRELFKDPGNYDEVA